MLEHKKVLSLGRLPKERSPPRETRRHRSEREKEPEKPIENVTVEKAEEEEEVVQIRTRSLVTPQLLDLDDEDDDSK